MQRSIQSFPLSSGQKQKLKAAGFEKVEDMKDISLVDLSKELSISGSEALTILNIIRGGDDNTPSNIFCSVRPTPAVVGDMRPLEVITRGQSALELLRAEQMQSFIVTFSAKVDEMLGGGIPPSKITELCGAPGIGKTQFSMQLAVDVSIPEAFGGVEGEAVYIDTEGSFIVERVTEIATAAVQHVLNLASGMEESEMVKCAREFTLERVLGNIHYFRCHDYIEVVALVNILPQIVAQHPKVKLVVIDSIASPFRHGFTDMGMRNRILSGMAQNLIRLATLRNLAVVLTNQMTTKPDPLNPTCFRLVPALGESWGHVCTIRVVLYWNQSQRFALLYKSPTKKESVVPFHISEDGVRDVVEDSESLSQDPELLKDLMFLTSSQLYELENSPAGYDSADHEWNSHTESGDCLMPTSRKRVHSDS